MVEFATPIIEDVWAALAQWKAARAIFSSALESYLTTCDSLVAACTQPTRLRSERNAVDDALVAVDSELGLISSEIHTLRTSHISMCTLRNKSGRLTRINILPPEVLRSIFRLSNTYCVHDHQAKGCYNALAQVDRYWRQVALDTPELWTHVDVSPDTPTRSMYGLSRMMLERSKGEPIDLHVYEPENTAVGGPTHQEETEKFKKFLSPYIPHIVKFRLETSLPSSYFVHSLTELWDEIHIANLHDMSIILPNPYGAFISHIRFPGTRGVEQTPEAYFQTLHLQNAMLDLGSLVCHGLVDLRIECTNGTIIPDIDVYDLAVTLAASPNLAVLKLQAPFSRWSELDLPLVTLSNLEVLNLTKLEPESLRVVLPLISRPNPQTKLSVGLTFYDDEQLLSEYRSFFSRCGGVSTLYHESTAEFLSMPYLPSSLSHLVIHRSDLGQPPFFNEDPTQPLPRTITTITLEQCIVTLEGLMSLVAETGAQVVNLDRCLMDRLMDFEGTIQYVSDETRLALLDVYPTLSCNVSDVDTTTHLSCRIIFES
ncbi:F-box-like protein [Ceratobasidium sp. AG-Ba]|nr:F-box-like protein [Ceratobasidium sp. AG-Ba]